MSHGPTLGSLPNQHQKSDAVHIAIAPVIAACALEPGQRVGFVDEARTKVGPAKTEIGIVDPFLKNTVLPTQRFWLLLFPNSITSLRHEWVHPAFGENPDVEMSKAWITSYADRQCDGLSYDEIMGAAEDYIEHHEYFSQGGRFEGICVEDEFWDHYETVTGKKIEDRRRGSFFSCSC